MEKLVHDLTEYSLHSTFSRGFNESFSSLSLISPSPFCSHFPRFVLSARAIQLEPKAKEFLLCWKAAGKRGVSVYIYSMLHLRTKLLICAAFVPPKTRKSNFRPINDSQSKWIAFGMLYSRLGGSQNNSKTSPVENWWAPAVLGAGSKVRGSNLRDTETRLDY